MTRPVPTISMSREMIRTMSSPLDSRRTHPMLREYRTFLSIQRFAEVRGEFPCLRHLLVRSRLILSKVSSSRPILQNAPSIPLELHECLYLLRSYHISICYDKSTRFSQFDGCVSRCHSTPVA